MFNGVFNFFAQLLATFYDFTGSYAFAIAMLTVAVNIVMAPLTMKAARSSIEMQRWAPEIKKIQKEFSDDRERQSQEMMAFYKEHNINPLGGCLPQLVQAPIFLVVYQVMRGLFRRVDGAESNFNPKYLDNCCADSDLNNTLKASSEANSLGVDLSQTALDVLGDNVVEGLPYLFLIGLVALTGWYQHRQIQGRNSNGAAMNSQQQAILKYLPFMLPIFSFSFPAGLVFYFFTGNLFRVGLQGFIGRKYYRNGELTVPAELQEDSPKASNNSKAKAAGGKGSAKNASAKDTSAKDTKRASPAKKSSSPASANGSGKRSKRSVGGRVTGSDSHGGRSESRSNGRSASRSAHEKRSASSGSSRPRNGGGGRVTPPGGEAGPPRKKRKKR